MSEKQLFKEITDFVTCTVVEFMGGSEISHDICDIIALKVEAENSYMLGTIDDKQYASLMCMVEKANRLYVLLSGFNGVNVVCWNKL